MFMMRMCLLALALLCLVGCGQKNIGSPSSTDSTSALRHADAAIFVQSPGRQSQSKVTDHVRTLPDGRRVYRGLVSWGENGEDVISVSWEHAGQCEWGDVYAFVTVVGEDEGTHAAKAIIYDGSEVVVYRGEELQVSVRQADLANP
jgi:hypothetical protein